MANAQKLKSEFDQAKRELMSALLAGDGGGDVAIQSALDRMTRAFNALLVSTLDSFADVPGAFTQTVEPEFLCAYAVNLQNGWDGSDWRVMYIHGKPVEDTANPPTVRDFTYKMLEDGWEIVTSSQCEAAASQVSIVDGVPVHELYFRRRLSQRAHERLRTTKDMTVSDTSLVHGAN